MKYSHYAIRQQAHRRVLIGFDLEHNWWNDIAEFGSLDEELAFHIADLLNVNG